MLNLIEFLNIIDCEKVYIKVYHLWMKTEMIQINLSYKYVVNYKLLKCLPSHTRDHFN